VDLDELVARLSRRDEVDGIVFVGSTGTKALRPSSDYDVLIVINEPPVPLLVGLTSVDGRLTDLLFATTSEVEELLSGARAPAEAWTGRLARWVSQGTIVFDRSGRLEALHKLLSERPLVSAQDLVHETWFSLNYDLAQNRRIAASAESVDRTALQLRLLYGIFGLVQGYFRLRGLDWRGEKAAVRYLAAEDPDYLDALRTCLDEVDLERRVALYEALAEQTLRRFGGLWNPGETIFQFRPGSEVSPELISETTRFWSSLVRG
jgi:nucleotidyltransferase-like protein